jgi:hypothetical protein
MNLPCRKRGKGSLLYGGLGYRSTEVSLVIVVFYLNIENPIDDRSHGRLNGRSRTDVVNNRRCLVNASRDCRGPHKQSGVR